MLFVEMQYYCCEFGLIERYPGRRAGPGFVVVLSRGQISSAVSCRLWA